jgi:predicted dienelactone hydrolase
MRTLLALFVALAATAHAASPAVECLRTSGAVGVRCLDQYADVLRTCRKRDDAACEAAARAPGGRLAQILARTDAAAAHCTDAAADALGYVGGADDVVKRIRESCGDFGEDGIDVAFGDDSSVAGAFPSCQREVANRLERLREATVRLYGEVCYLDGYRGRGCDRARRDRRIAEAQASVERRILRRCGGSFASLGLGTLDDVIETVTTRARHYAQRVYPPNDLGPTADFGPYPVGIKTLALSDPSRQNTAGTGPRPVLTEVYYPSTAAAVAGLPRDVAVVLGIPVVETPAYRDVAMAPGTYPLVVFSHGNGGLRIQSFFFAAHLASHGYIVVSPDHHGNTFVDQLAGIVDPNVAVNRPLDMSFLIDEFLAFNGTAGTFFQGSIDPARIGASGHSFGGYTSFALASGPFEDARVKAIMPQAPAAPFDEAFFDAIHVPVFIVGGSIDMTTPFDGSQQRPFDLLPSGAAVVALAKLAEAGHFTFSDFCEVDRDLLGFLGGFSEACEPRHMPWRHAHDIVNYFALNFFDATLNDDADALARLDPTVVHDLIENVEYSRK